MGRVGLGNLLLSVRVCVHVCVNVPDTSRPGSWSPRSGVAALMAEPARTAPQSWRSLPDGGHLGLIVSSYPRGGEGHGRLKAKLIPSAACVEKYRTEHANALQSP